MGVGGGQQAHVHREGAGAAQTGHLAFFEDAQQLGLGLEGQVAHFVEEQGSPVGGLEETAVHAGSAGESPFFVAEELALDQFVGQGRTVDRQERTVLAGAEGMDGPGHQFLASAALAGDQHGRLERRGPADLIEHVLHGRRGAQQPSEPGILLVVGQATGQHQAALQGLVHAGLQVFGLQRFEHVVHGAQLHGLDRALGRSVRRDDDRRNRRLAGDCGTQHLDSGGTGHLQVGDYCVDRFVCEDFQGPGAVLGLQHLVSELPQHAGHDIPKALFVIDDQDGAPQAVCVVFWQTVMCFSVFYRRLQSVAI